MTHRPSRLRRACEFAIACLLVTLVLRTWFVSGLVIPMTVAGGSMAPALLGPHRQAVCGVCQHTFAVGLERLPTDGRATCPRCGDSTIDVGALTDRPGKRLLVDRTAFEFRSPGRWELVVFRCPERADDYCIKRVVGLPGESIQIHQGDVYVDGKIARKSLPQFRAIAQLVYAAGPGASRWRGDEGKTRWTSEDGPDGRTFSYSKHAIDENGSVDWLSYHHLGGKRINDDVPYNQGESRLLGPVTDLLLTCRVRLLGEGELFLSVPDGPGRFTIAMAASDGRLRLLEAGRPLAEVNLDRPIAAALVGDGADLELALVDHQLLLAVDGRVQLAYEYRASKSASRRASGPPAIGSRGLGVEISELRVWRDIYYTEAESRGGREAQDAYSLAADEFFVLGDNSPISADSRSWRHAGLAAKLLVGKPLGVE